MARSKADQLEAELRQLAERCRGQMTDADRDIDFAYRHMGLPGLSPLEAPSLGAWQWYLKAIDEPSDFLEICAKREDAKMKMAGTITEKRMADDKREKFAVIDRLKGSLQLSISSVLKESWERWPDLTRAALRESGWTHKSDVVPVTPAPVRRDWERIQYEHRRLCTWATTLANREKQLRASHPEVTESLANPQSADWVDMPEIPKEVATQ